MTDRHYELAKLHLDLFGCDKSLLRCFLDASDCPVKKTLPHQALALALHRQAHGSVQHARMDVFHELPKQFSLQDISSMHELAEVLFGV